MQGDTIFTVVVMYVFSVRHIYWQTYQQIVMDDKDMVEMVRRTSDKVVWIFQFLT